MALSSDIDEIPADLPTDLVIDKLADLGLSAEAIAISLGLSASKVRSRVVIRTKSGIAPEEKQLAEEVRHLASLCIKRATLMVEFGPTDQKIAIIRAVLGNASRLIGADTGSSTAEIRQDLEALLMESRTIPFHEKVVTDEGIIDVESIESLTESDRVSPQTAAETVDDQDEGFGAPEVRS